MATRPKALAQAHSQNGALKTYLSLTIHGFYGTAGRSVAELQHFLHFSVSMYALLIFSTAAKTPPNLISHCFELLYTQPVWLAIDLLPAPCHCGDLATA